jgi:hypothetical protein
VVEFTHAEASQIGPFAVAAVTELAPPTAAMATTAYSNAFIFIRYFLRSMRCVDCEPR